MLIDSSESEPVTIDLNVDAALLLKHMVGIDSYPPVLALLPNIYNIEDRDRVHAVVKEQLVEAGVVEGDRVHPRVERWLWCLYRPDAELVVRIVDTGRDGADAGMLRMSLVRSGDEHVLALRCDDQVVIQSVFHEGKQLHTLAEAVRSALGSAPALQFEPFSADEDALGAVPDDPEERRKALRELGAVPHTAGVLTRSFAEVIRRAEVLMVEHRDGGAGSATTTSCVSVLDTLSGRVIATPNSTMDGRIRSSFFPGDDAALNASIAALIELLPGRSWFDTARAS